MHSTSTADSNPGCKAKYLCRMSKKVFSKGDCTLMDVCKQQITNQEKTPAVIHRALAKHNLESDTAEDYELVQVISRDKELVIPSNANVFYAMNSRVSFNLLLRKKSSVNKQMKMRSWSSLTFPRTAKRGCRSNRPSKITP